MIKTNFARLALLSSVATVAFDSNGPGWKMDGDKIALDGSGNPIWINAEGQEGAIKGDTIATLNAEAKTLRTQRDQGQQIIDKYKGADGKLIDPAAAITALSTVKDIDASKLIQADKLEELRTQMRSEFTTQLGEVTTDRDGWKTKYEDKLIDDVFNDPFMNNIAMPKDFFAAAMRKNFKVEDGKVVAYDSAGNRLNSKKEVGTFAGVSEALELIVNAHPQKDTLLKPDTGNGSGSGGGGGQRGGSRRISRAEFSGLDPVKKAEAAEAQSKGELVIFDA